jgi:type VI secretion system protein ImpJ
MISKKPLFWHQGLFLQPQHFQYMDTYVQSLLSPLLECQHPFFWGVITMEINEAALKNRTFELIAGEFLFRDGTAVAIPANGTVQPRSFDEAGVEGERPFTVYLGLRRYARETQNVTVVKRLDDVADVNTRFAATEEAEEMADMYKAGPAAQVRRLTYVLKIFWENEIEKLNNYHLIPLAMLERDGADIKLSRSFIPPAVAVSGSDELTRMLKDIRDQVTARCHQLEEYKSPREIQATEFEPGYMICLLALRSLNRFVPLLFHLAETSPLGVRLPVRRESSQLCFPVDGAGGDVLLLRAVRAGGKGNHYGHESRPLRDAPGKDHVLFTAVGYGRVSSGRIDT